MRGPTEVELRQARIDAAAHNQYKLICPDNHGALVLSKLHPNVEEILRTARCPRCNKRVYPYLKDLT